VHDLEVFQYKVNNKELTLGEDVFDAVKIEKIDAEKYRISKDGKNYIAKHIDVCVNKRQVSFYLNNKKYSIELKNKFDLFIESMGYTSKSEVSLSEVKAPMPGLVFDILVSEDQEVTAGESLLILEAMKMENVIKSPRDGKIASINVEKGNSVEKNAILIEFV